MVYTPNIMETVTTYDGTPALRKDCRFIKGAYYKKETQCFYIGGTWYRINSNKIAFDHEKKIWVVLDSLGPFNYLLNGIIDIKDGVPEFGKFSPNYGKNSSVFYKGCTYPVIDIGIVEKNFESGILREGVNGKYYFPISVIPKEFTHKLKPNRDRYYTFPYNYGSEPLIPEFTENFDKSFVGDKLISTAYTLLDKFTFGVEFETEVGAIPEKYLINNGLIACRDGSITGFEYATIPLSGKSGIQCIKRSCELLNKYCACSPNESLHIHVGGFPRTIKNIASLYRLGLIVEKEIYSLFPYYYANTSHFKKKGYCNPLYMAGRESDNARDIFLGIYHYLSGGVGRFTRFPTGTHPMDRSGQHKWEISPRYHWLNLIPLIWGNRGTVEFRCHTPTVKYEKVVSWLFIVVAIMKYAIKHNMEFTSCMENALPKISLKEILSESYPNNICKNLNEYISYRKAHYKDRNDSVGEMEIYSEPFEEIIPLSRFV